MQYIILMALTIVLNVCGHLFLKAGMLKIGAITPEQLISNFGKIFFTPFVLLGLASYVSSVAMYIVVLSKIQLSYAYPLLMSLGYILIVLFSWRLFGEPFSSYKWIGLGLILCGIILIGK
jgi:multidrug transporter EmrE-like cation transporter